MAFTAQDVKTLREITGCGMMDCKKALTETNGDQEKAIELLREKGLAAAAKKAGRIAGGWGGKLRFVGRRRLEHGVALIAGAHRRHQRQDRAKHLRLSEGKAV